MSSTTTALPAAPRADCMLRITYDAALEERRRENLTANGVPYRGPVVRVYFRADNATVLRAVGV